MLRARLSKSAVIAAAILAVPTLTHAQTDGTWGVNASGSWSTAANWVGGNIPGGGGVANFVLIPNYTELRTITQDVVGLQLSQINFDSAIQYSIGGTQGIELVGAGIVHTASSNLSSNTLFAAGHPIGVPITGSVGLTKTGNGVLTISGTNTFTGAVNVNGGVFRTFVGDVAFGNAANQININNATIRSSTGLWTTARAINLTGTCNYEGFSAGTFNGVISGGGSFNKVVAATATFFGAANTYTGATNHRIGTLILGSNGSILNTSAILAGGTIGLDNSATNVNDRLPDALPITFLGSGLNLTGNSGAATSETYGQSIFNGGNTFYSVLPNAAQNATITSAGVTRQNGGAVFFRGVSLGNAPAANVANIMFTAAPAVVGGGGAAGSTNISIIPWAWGNNASGAAAAGAATNSLVTYSTDGIRPLNLVTEHVATVGDGSTSTDNLRLAAGLALTSTTTVNSLTNTTGGSLTGTGTLVVTSGAVLNLAAATHTANLDFGAAEGVIMTPAAGTFSGIISGSGGLTKAGGSAGTFSGANTYTGQTIIAGGTANVMANLPESANSPLGNSSTPIILAPGVSGRAGIYQGFAGVLTIDRDLILRGNADAGTCVLGTSGSTGQAVVMNGDITFDTNIRLRFEGSGTAVPVTVNGVISGPGFLTDGFSTNTTLNGNNTFTGGIELTTGAFLAGHDNAFGTGVIYLTGAGSLAAAGGARTIANNIVVETGAGVNIGGSNPFTLTGTLDMNGATITTAMNITNSADTEFASIVKNGNVVKAGAGKLILSGNNVFTGIGTVSAGILEIRHANALGTTANPTNVIAGAQLALSNNALSSEPVNVAGDGPGGSGAIRSISGTNSLGPITLTGTSIQVDADTLSSGLISGPAATLNKNGAGVLKSGGYRVQTLNVNVGTAGITAGRSTSKTSTMDNLVITAGAALDLDENDAVVRLNTLASVVTDLTTGYNGGAWTGNGITSTAAANSPSSSKTALGVALASDSFLSGAGVFSGQPVSATDVLIRYTIAGDANLDGTSNSADFNILATNFGVTSPTMYWATGDFTYNNAVNSADFNVLASGFGQTVASGSAGPGGAVPEPTGLALLGLGSLLALRRRR